MNDVGSETGHLVRGLSCFHATASLSTSPNLARIRAHPAAAHHHPLTIARSLCLYSRSQRSSRTHEIEEMLRQAGLEAAGTFFAIRIVF